jgi:hypothetical protein
MIKEKKIEEQDDSDFAKESMTGYISGMLKNLTPQEITDSATKTIEYVSQSVQTTQATFEQTYETNLKPYDKNISLAQQEFSIFSMIWKLIKWTFYAFILYVMSPCILGCLGKVLPVQQFGAIGRRYETLNLDEDSDDDGDLSSNKKRKPVELADIKKKKKDDDYGSSLSN